MSAIAYQGIVQMIKRYRGKLRENSLYHNNGSTHLFELLTTFLSTGKGSGEVVPNYLDIGFNYSTTSSALPEWKSLLTSRVGVTSRTRGYEDGLPAVKCTWDLTANQMNSFVQGSGQNPIILRVYAKADDQDYLMEVQLVNSEGEPITDYGLTQGESQEIYWTMSFINVESQGD